MTPLRGALSLKHVFSLKTDVKWTVAHKKLWSFELEMDTLKKAWSFWLEMHSGLGKQTMFSQKHMMFLHFHNFQIISSQKLALPAIAFYMIFLELLVLNLQFYKKHIVFLSSGVPVVWSFVLERVQNQSLFRKHRILRIKIKPLFLCHFPWSSELNLHNSTKLDKEHTWNSGALSWEWTP